MSIHKGVKVRPEQTPNAHQEWKFEWPNTADFNFDYYRLLKISEQHGIGTNQNPDLKIAVIGAGIAGLTAARELFRSGFTNIDIYEASDRIGGRTYSIKADNQHTTYEMGAMRMPFFPYPGSENCVLDYYRELFKISCQPFPNPGSAVTDTGIFMNDGLGPDKHVFSTKPQLIIWKKEDENPPTEILRRVNEKWTRFRDLITSVTKEIYETPEWPEFWRNMVFHYWEKNFRDLVFMSAAPQYNPEVPGYFGGLGMNREEAEIFHTIGAGDGGWGAFYFISALYPIRTLLFGFGTELQLVQGRFDKEGHYRGGPFVQAEVFDSLGNPLPHPHYLGMAAFADSLLYLPVLSSQVDAVSLYAASKSSAYNVNLYTQNPVESIKNVGTRKTRLVSPAKDAVYDAVVITPPTWATQMSLEFSNFGRDLLPINVRNSIKTSHWITSCKIFYPLKARYWEETNIPQVISTDTYLQGVYGYAVETDNIQDEPGVLLLSYTWEDDANKFLADTDDDLVAKKCLDKLDEILLECENIGRPISPFVDTRRPYILHWSKEPSYRGCAKLYRERTWSDNYALLTYNQALSQSSGLYFAGESTSLEGGWTEPALREALDAVVHIINNHGGAFNNEFNFDRDYPKYDIHWEPASTNSLFDQVS